MKNKIIEREIKRLKGQDPEWDAKMDRISALAMEAMRAKPEDGEYKTFCFYLAHYIDPGKMTPGQFKALVNTLWPVFNKSKLDALIDGVSED